MNSRLPFGEGLLIEVTLMDGLEVSVMLKVRLLGCLTILSFEMGERGLEWKCLCGLGSWFFGHHLINFLFFLGL